MSPPKSNRHSAAVSFQNSQHITFDSGTVTQTSGTGLEFIPASTARRRLTAFPTISTPSTANNVVENSAFYDIGALGIRIGNPFQPADTDANVPQFDHSAEQRGGRLRPHDSGLLRHRPGQGHDNLYTHNDVYDGYHCAISTSQSIGANTKPTGIGNANNIISFNHVYNLFQGIMNDGGSIRIDGGNASLHRGRATRF